MFRPSEFLRPLRPAAGPSRRRLPRKAAPQLDSLEDRVVLSHFGGGFAARAAQFAALGGGRGAFADRLAMARAFQSLSTGQAAATTASTAVVSMASPTPTTPTTPTSSTTDPDGDSDFGGGGGMMAPPWGGFHEGGPGGATQDPQLTQDLQQLQTDTRAILANSAVTDAQRLALGQDLRTIAQSGYQIDPKAFGTFASDLLNALADGTYASDPTVAQNLQTEFNALFTGSSIDQATIDQTFNDLVAVAKNLNATTDQLTALANDEQAIASDLARLNPNATTPPSVPSTSLGLILGGPVGLGFGPGFGEHHGFGRGDFGLGFGGFGRGFGR